MTKSTQDRMVFYRHSEDSPCGYLSNKNSNSIFIDPEYTPSEDELNLLHLQGFRRSGRLIYRPHCPNCNACQSSRIINKEFRVSKSQKRCVKNNADLNLAWAKAEFTREHYNLYEVYIAKRHKEGEMFPASEEQYKGFLIEGYGSHRFLEARDSEGCLIACMVVDVFYDGFSAIYCYFNPELDKRGLGRFMILALVEQGKNMGFQYTYLGYWIKESSKMNYKSNYQPLEVFYGDCWKKLTNED